MKKIYSLVAAIVLGTGLTATAQHVHDYKCGHAKAHAKILQEHPEIQQIQEMQDAYIADYLRNNPGLDRDDSTVIYTIPVVFHIVHNFGPENIPNANILDQVYILNRDYQKLNQDTADVVPAFRSSIAKCGFQFKLATIDPLGNCTNGIDRVVSPLTTIGSDIAKLNPWPRHKYMNVWIINNMEDGVAGYAYYPSATADAGSSWKDGIIIRYQYIGSLFPANPSYSRALTHEVGHWLDLSHTWGSTNDPEVACGDDNVMDTPPTAGHDNCQNVYDYECDTKALPLATNQLQTVYQFNGVDVNTGNVDTLGTPYVDDAGLIFSDFQATGLSANSAVAGQFAFSGWGTGAADGASTYGSLTGSFNASKYYEFTLSNDVTQNLDLTSITFDIQRSADGPRTFAVRSSADNFATNLSGVVTPANGNLNVQAGNVFFVSSDVNTSITGTKINLGGNNFTNINGESITFRVYAWNAEDAAGSFGVDNVSAAGSYGTIENVQNYMEYSYCSKMFTWGQRDRMIGALNTPIASRNNLWTAENLAATGTDGIHDQLCAPQADFYPEKKMVCQGNDVQFFDYSSDAEATSWEWTFQDAVPATSTASNPTVSFTSGGWKTVTLTVTNAQGSTTITDAMAIYVTQSWPEIPGILASDFNTNPFQYGYYFSDNQASNESNYEYASNAGVGTANGSVVLDNASVQVPPSGMVGFDVDELITPSMDLSLLSSGKLKFDYAYSTGALTEANITESLEIWSSRDCGETWQLRTTISGLDLVTAGAYAAPFVPNTILQPETGGAVSGAQWKQKSVTIPSTYETDNVRFKFIFKSSEFSNNFYLDNINVTGTVSVNEFAKQNTMVVYPNPAGEVLNVQLPANGQKYSTAQVMDLSGRVVMTQGINGMSNIQINTDILPAGMYVIQVRGEGGVMNQEFLKGIE